MATKIYVSVEEAARQLGVSRARVYVLVAQNRVPHIRDGRAVRIPRVAWERWLQIQAEQAMAVVGR